MYVSDSANIDSGEHDDEHDDDEYGVFNEEEECLREFMLEWKEGMEIHHISRLRTSGSGPELSFEEARTLWPWTPTFGDLSWEMDQGDELRTGEYRSHVWSPYAIPRALDLFHGYHRRARYSSMEFKTYWKYHLVDFEDVDTIAKKLDLDSCFKDEVYYESLCSNYFEDEELRMDVIDAKNLTIKTVRKLRRFLYGTNRSGVICDHHDFLRLLFASMGTIDTGCDPKGGWLGYEWVPDREARQEFMKEQIPIFRGKFDPEGDPGESEGDYYECSVTWLAYYIAKAADDLDPITVRYKPPRKEDAPGWYEGYEDEHGSGADQAALIEMYSNLLRRGQRQG
uniref:Uncharacterized protein n=1 Tax=Leptocylindrus danicus TaxID=163516 RepID=A0A7S2LM06_9STRA